ncbi:MAG: hypothetical protein HQL56_09360 [Magnetococcales bacterium]|nr:hypothetical protein [Magnetococcales bacterium]
MNQEKGEEKVSDRILKAVPEFHSSIADQCELLLELGLLVERYTSLSGSEMIDLSLLDKLEERKEQFRNRNMDKLHQSFHTNPFERDDLYWIFFSINKLIADIKNMLRMMQALGIGTDHHMAVMARMVREACFSLRRGYRKVASNPIEGLQDAQVIRSLRDMIEDTYNVAISELYDGDEIRKSMSILPHADANMKAVAQVMEMFKRREVYRYFFDLARELGEAATVLQSVVYTIA